MGLGRFVIKVVGLDLWIAADLAGEGDERTLSDRFERLLADVVFVAVLLGRLLRANLLGFFSRTALAGRTVAAADIMSTPVKGGQRFFFPAACANLCSRGWLGIGSVDIKRRLDHQCPFSS
jgi:hypothetical protein